MTPPSPHTAACAYMVPLLAAFAWLVQGQGAAVSTVIAGSLAVGSLLASHAMAARVVQEAGSGGAMAGILLASKLTITLAVAGLLLQVLGALPVVLACLAVPLGSAVLATHTAIRAADATALPLETA